jgi:hypothetical protein
VSKSRWSPSIVPRDVFSPPSATIDCNSARSRCSAPMQIGFSQRGTGTANATPAFRTTWRCRVLGLERDVGIRSRSPPSCRRPRMASERCILANTGAQHDVGGLQHSMPRRQAPASRQSRFSFQYLVVGRNVGFRSGLTSAAVNQARRLGPVGWFPFAGLRLAGLTGTTLPETD